MAPTTSSTAAENGSATTRSNPTTSNHNHNHNQTSTFCLNGIDQQNFSTHHMNAALANTSRHQLRTENSAEEASVAASTARMNATLEELDRIMKE